MIIIMSHDKHFCSLIVMNHLENNFVIILLSVPGLCTMWVCIYPVWKWRLFYLYLKSGWFCELLWLNKYNRSQTVRSCLQGSSCTYVCEQQLTVWLRDARSHGSGQWASWPCPSPRDLEPWESSVKCYQTNGDLWETQPAEDRRIIH